MTIESYYEEYWSGEYHDPLDAPRRELLWSIVNRVCPSPGRYYEFGCGRGDLVASAADRGWDAAGSDISATAVEQARRLHPGVQFEVATAESDQLAFADGSVDLLVSFEVIEHLFAPRGLTDRAHQLLRPGGLCVISTPYHGQLKNLLLAIRGFDRHFDVEGQHIRFFTDASLSRILMGSGLEVSEVHHLGRIRALWANTVVFARKPSP